MNCRVLLHSKVRGNKDETGDGVCGGVGWERSCVSCHHYSNIHGVLLYGSDGTQHSLVAARKAYTLCANIAAGPWVAHGKPCNRCNRCSTDGIKCDVWTRRSNGKHTSRVSVGVYGVTRIQADGERKE